MRILFDVFGTKMSVERRNDEWILYQESETGMRVKIYDVYIPSELAENELLTFLDDMYHEHATATQTKVLRLK
ncbi:hypothetical protein TW78_11395 [Vibrio coralliilyticus]|uniref:DUF7661 domain-containing protein n=1 Tax=Vibrio coralliilyticus TaxID=190893 RepID=A0A837G0H9_9VIBR|nr:hypothetical protein [Vibrio coralliilyticus]KJY72530.1 hypothetical protein TW78_11395 [Vibrio coralliilyticus]QOU31614.1 hypothetical protein TW71_020390 [Vibrio coralliilyticus]